MSRVVDLIGELCPDGVEYRPLGELLRIRNGSDYKSFDPGSVPVYGSGGIMTHVNRYAYSGPSVLIPRKGSLNKLYFVDTPFWTVDTIFYTEIGERLDPKFLFHKLKTMRLEELNQAGGVPSLTQGVLNQLRVPVPPLEVQQKIARTLDLFSELEQELEQELEGRRRQYEHYRNQIFGSCNKFSLRPLGTLAWNLDRLRKPITKELRTAGNTPYYGASGAVDFVEGHIFDEELLLVSEDGANLVARTTPIAFSIKGKSWVNNHAHVLKFDSPVTRHFVELYINSIDVSRFVSSGPQPKLNKANLDLIPIPVPPLEEQRRIVEILDKFDALVNDLSIGLPAEIKARRKQYEYYRDKLLTFKELPA